MAQNSDFKLTTLNGELERIGQGFCGTVWAEKCSTCDSSTENHKHIAIKREDGGPGRSLANEYLMHQRILERLHILHAINIATFNVPDSKGFLDKEASSWADILPRLPTGYTSCNALLSEKIPPVSTPVRRLLVENFLPGVDLDKVLGSESNKHCLIRLYLGRRRHRQDESPEERPGRRLQVFSLRNFPLHVDQMEQIGVDPAKYAVAMADALAFLHWSAKIDANDVEFVLGAPRALAAPTSLMNDFGTSSKIDFSSRAM